jgi:hypothetical protein
MSEELNNVSETPVEVQEQKTTNEQSISVDDYNKLKSENDAIKKAQSGSDKKVAELSALLEEMKKSNMNQKDRENYELELMKTQLNKYKTKDLKSNILTEYELDSNMINYLNGDSEESLRLQAIELKKLKEQMRAEAKKEYLKDNSHTPKSGNNTADTTSNLETKDDLVQAAKQVNRLRMAGKKDEAKVLLSKILEAQHRINKG